VALLAHLQATKNRVRAFHLFCPPGSGRFIKTLLCVHDNGGLVVVKVGASSRGSARAASRVLGSSLACAPPRGAPPWRS
jgi:hypothetical protein